MLLFLGKVIFIRWINGLYIFGPVLKTDLRGDCVFRLCSVLLSCENQGISQGCFISNCSCDTRGIMVAYQAKVSVSKRLKRGCFVGVV